MLRPDKRLAEKVGDAGGYQQEDWKEKQRDQEPTAIARANQRSQKIVDTGIACQCAGKDRSGKHRKEADDYNVMRSRNMDVNAAKLVVE